MADDPQVEILRQGAAHWNAWRQANPQVRPRLGSGALRGLDLAGANLSQADLGRADLRGAILREAILIGARLDGANLFKAVLEGADLAGSSLRDAQFLNCAQIMSARNWQGADRDETLACGAPIPAKEDR
jgi:uncharacterized protein YjbI with pentapeptide repeats